MNRRASVTVQGPANRGVTLVEFAFIAPIIFAMFFASIEFSRANMLRHSIEIAAYEGCRSAIIPGATAQDAIDAATAVLTATSAKNATITVTPSVITRNTNNVTVTVALPLNGNVWVAPKFLGNSTLTTTINMNREYLDEFGG